ncbi:MAG: D-alanine--D-alanine ligase [Ruminococcaceae bacterium]|nr:D-alanine--D-alanine ligase [Oscillospiraceae bacterium]
MDIVVLAGGTSTERDVSLITGKNVTKALRRKGHRATLLDVFMGYEGDAAGFFDTDGIDETLRISDTDPDIKGILAARKGDAKGLFGENVISLCKAADIVFIALHGEDGEDGKVQAAFDLMGIPYTGSGSFGSALAMNKYVAKELMDAHGIKNAKYIITKGGEKAPEFPIPCVIKPFSGGSSVGVSIVTEQSEYDAALQQAAKYESDIIIEEYIKGREFSLGIVGGRALPPIEIIPKEGFYDYKNKYQEGMTVEICPAELDEALTRKMQAQAKQVFDALCLDVYGRIDFILKDGTEDFYCLEANSLPGMTSMSLLPQEAAAVGIAYDDLCQMIIDLSLDKYKDRL